MHVVVPAGIDDPRRPSGGNVYDRRLCDELAAAGWSVHEHEAGGGWPQPDAADLAGLGRLAAGMPDGALVLVDGLVASAAADVLLGHADRLRLVILVHLPLAEASGGADPDVRRREGALLAAATAVLVTSAWSRARLLTFYPLAPGRVHVAEPGVDPAELAPGTTSGGELLCVAAVARHKGHDVLLEALARIRDLSWRCTCVGTVDREPVFVAELRRRAREDELGQRVRFTGALSGPRLDERYASSDLLVLPSRGETYGMVVAEALVRGIPVVASDVGGLAQTVGQVPDAGPPGLLLPAGDPAALAGALQSWLRDARLRDRLRLAARARRDRLTGWPVTAARVARVLAEAE